MSRIVQSLIAVVIGVMAASLSGCPNSGSEGGKTAVDTGSRPVASQPDAPEEEQINIIPQFEPVRFVLRISRHIDLILCIGLDSERSLHSKPIHKK